LPIERICDEGFLDEFNLLLLSYDIWKPQKPKYNECMAEWINDGGVLIFAGGSDECNNINEWWTASGYKTPQDHLFHLLGVSHRDTSAKTMEIGDDEGFTLHPSTEALNEVTVDGCRLTVYAYGELAANVKSLYALEGSGFIASFEACYGKGHVIFFGVSPVFFAQSFSGANVIRSLIRYACEEKLGIPYREQGYLKLRRGRYVIVQSLEEDMVLKGKFLDLFDTRIRLVEGFKVPRRGSALLYAVEDLLDDHRPRLLFSSHKLVSKKERSREIVFSVKGPLKTRGVSRIALNGNKLSSITARGPEVGSPLLNCDQEDDTLYVCFENYPQRITVKATFRTG